MIFSWNIILISVSCTLLLQLTFPSVTFNAVQPPCPITTSPIQYTCPIQTWAHTCCKTWRQQTTRPERQDWPAWASLQWISIFKITFSHLLRLHCTGSWLSSLLAVLPWTCPASIRLTTCSSFCQVCQLSTTGWDPVEPLPMSCRLIILTSRCVSYPDPYMGVHRLKPSLNNPGISPYPCKAHLLNQETFYR